MKSKRRCNDKDATTITKKKKVDTVSKNHNLSITIDFTGIREGEVIEGVNAKQSKGVEMIVKGDTYFPIRLLDAQYVRDSIGSFRFFSKMTLEERLEWLKENLKTYKAPRKENHLVDNDLKVKFIKIENAHFLEKIGVDSIQTLLGGNPDDEEGYWPIAHVYGLFKPKDFLTKANRFSLLLRPENWKLKEDNLLSSENAEHSKPFDGTIVSIYKGEDEGDSPLVTISYNEYVDDHIGSAIDKTAKLLHVTSDLAISFPLTLPKMPEFDELARAALALIHHDENTKEEEEEVDTELDYLRVIYLLVKHFTPSMLKSLIQKIIRTKANFIEHENVEYSSRLFLIVAIIALARHSGSYNQNKHRYVTGLESVTKRLAVIVCEDSYTRKKETLTGLLAVAYIRQQDKSYIPPFSHFKQWFRIALDALNSSYYYEYDTKTDLKPQLGNSIKQNTAIVNYLLIKKIGSFQGDINMFSYIATNPTHYTSFKGKYTSPIVMPLIHAIDQHCCTSLAHFMKPVKEDDSSGVDETTFKSVFTRLWNEVSSVNGRKDYDYIQKMETSDFVKDVRFAQRCIYNLKCHGSADSNEKDSISMESYHDDEDKEKEDDTPTSLYEFEYALDKSWICGLIGAIEVGKAIVVLRTDSIYDMVVIRKPKSRQTASDMKSSATTKNEFTQEEKEELIELAKDKLRQGYYLSHVPSTLEKFKNAKVWLSDDSCDEEPRYLIQFNNSNIKIDWDEALHIRYSIPLFRDHDITTAAAVPIEYAINYEKDGILYNADTKFDNLLKDYTPNVLKRLLMYMNNYREVVKLHEIARDGSSIHLSVSLLDIAVNHLLCTICVLYPYCLKLEKTGTFRVKNGPVLWYIKGKIKALVAASSSATSTGNGEEGDYWKTIHCDESKPLYPHQRESVDAMLKKKLQENKNNHGIFIDVGLGKTAIAIEYIRSLIEKGKMCDYCVYTAPPGALENAKSEFSRYGLKYKMITEGVSSSSARLKDVKLEKYVVNIIAHDHMRRDAVYKQLKKHAPNTLFIVDEFHLTSTTNTIRSSIALEISLLSWDFIAMTGTLIRRENPADVIHWLEQIVDFYVDGYNYWVAFGALISKKAKTNVIVHHDDIMVKMEEGSKEDLEYRSLVTHRLGGHASSVNFQKASKLCYNVVDREMIALTREYVINRKEVIFILALTIKHQQKLKDAIVKELGISENDVFLITSKASIILRPEDETNIKVVITTLKHVTGYTLTKCKTCITSVYPSNQASRDQFEGRMNRLGQLSPEITIITVHCGILSYLLHHYRQAASLSQALKEFATDIDLDIKDLIFNMNSIANKCK